MVDYNIVDSILGNEKRVRKIQNIENVHEKTAQAERYVVGELRERRMKMTDAEIFKAACIVVQRAKD